MDEKQIELLIAKKVAEAKLDVAEKRLNYLIGIAGAMLAIFGVVLPFWTTNRASDKVDNALAQMKQELKGSSENLRTDSRASSELLDKTIQSMRADFRGEIDGQSRSLNISSDRVDREVQNMQKQFKELAGTAQRKPSLECRVGGLALDGKTVVLFQGQREVDLEIKNTGDAPARNIRVRLYANFGNEDYYLQSDLTSWSHSHSDEPFYRHMFETADRMLDSKDVYKIGIGIPTDVNGVSLKPGAYPVLMKIFYEQPEPRTYSFIISLKGSP